MLKIIHITTGPLDVNTYICYDQQSLDCFVVDPAEWLSVLNIIREKHLNCTHILLTHGHFDHILGVSKLKEELGAKICIHNDDERALYDDKINLSAFCGYRLNGPCKADILLEEKSKIEVAGLTIEVMHTPGHSKGSVCYIIESEKLIFSGDTLFRLGFGRTDLYGGSQRMLEQSLKRICDLPGNYTVLPGHNEATDLDFERMNNCF